ncbi:alpha/beta fold hydrolase [Umezawaea endophytica]|uniref:Alpha/beta hydrolase n=1 Tax=Umezawaea endophytica TaxID=1654476 RepID=A0A9X2VPV6_9PSEU|nr:alpha/beta hydrolase [Umezawaea endophytica]MCS7479258.1 alpha/beta hydrolase [Umezawaea endophytica]
MAVLSAPDGTSLVYTEIGEGPPLVCLPGGPMQDAAYLGDLGGPFGRRLVLLDPRGTGRSGTPADLTSCRCDRLVADVDALRVHLGLDRVDLLGHSAGANLAVTYAATHPDRVSGLVLVTPSTFAVGLTTTADHRRDVLRRRADEPWHDGVSTAFEQIVAGQGSDWDALVPFTYGRWDDAARAHHAAQEGRRNDEAAAAFRAEGAFSPEKTRAALATFPAPVLLIAGDLDMSVPPPVVAAFADLFPNARLHVQSGAGHFPWLDDPVRFAATIREFPAERPA